MNAEENKKPEAVILIHGMDGDIQGNILSKLERGIVDSTATGRVEIQVPTDVRGHSARVLEVSSPDDFKHTKTLHLYEAYWGDTLDKITQLGVRKQIGRGFELIFYWLGTPFMRAKNWYIAFGGTMTTIAMLLWWYGLVITGLGLAIPIAGDKSLSAIFLGWASKGGIWAYPSLVAGYLTHVYAGLGIMAITTPMTKIIESVVNILHNCSRYIFDDNLRHRIWKRLGSLVLELDESQQYSRITILSHSFGTVIHVNWMADYTGYSQTPVRHITMGGPMAVMALRSDLIMSDILNALKNPEVKKQEWTDFYSRFDWMCTAMPDGSGERSFKTSQLANSGRSIDSVCIEFPNSSLKKKFLGTHHTEYFHHESVIAKVVDLR